MFFTVLSGKAVFPPSPILLFAILYFLKINFFIFTNMTSICFFLKYSIIFRMFVSFLELLIIHFIAHLYHKY